MSRRATMTRHGGGSFGPSSSSSGFSSGGHGRHSQGSFGPSSDFGPPHGPPPPPDHGHFPPPPPRHHNQRFPRPYYQPYYFWPSSAYSSRPRDGRQMPPREAVARFDRKTTLLNRTKAVYIFLLLALCIGVLWLYTAVYASTVIQLGVHDSRLLSVQPYFVKTIQVKNRYEVDGPLFYEFDQRPALNKESTWTDSQTVNFNNGHEEFYYWLNKGSTVNVDYSLRSQSHKAVYLMFLQDDSENLNDYYRRPDYGPSVQLRGKGQTPQYEANTDADYVFSLVTYNPTNVSVDLNMRFHTREYSTAQAASHSKLKTSYDMSLSLVWANYGLLVGPGRPQGGVETWEIEISYGIRFNTIIFIFGLLTLCYLVTKARIMSSIHDLDGALPPEYAPLTQGAQDTQPSAPPVPSSIAEEVPEDARRNNIPEDQTCTVCLDARKDSFFVPCGHRATCFACGNRIAQSDPANCPICREPIQDVKRIYDV